MRIGIDVKCLSKRYTGIAIYVYDMIKYLNELNSTDDFFLYSHKDFQLDFKLNKNFHVVIYKAITGSFGVLFQLHKRLQKDKIDLFWGTEHCIPLGKQPFKQVVTIHDLAALHNPKISTKYNALLQKFMTIPACKRADKIIAISHSTANDVVNTAKIPFEKVEVIYNGDSPYLHNTELKEGCNYEDICTKYNIKIRDYMLFVGSIEPRKNIPTIVKAYEIYRQNGGNQKLVLAGGLGWKYTSTLNSIKGSSYSPDIIMTGYCSSLEKEFLYRNATMLVYPSLWEGFGFPILEAMSVGIPVITTKISSLPEVGGELSLYIEDPLDYDTLAKQMMKISELDFIEIEELRIKSIKWAKGFSRKKCAENSMQLFERLIQEQSI